MKLKPVQMKAKKQEVEIKRTMTVEELAKVMHKDIGEPVLSNNAWKLQKEQFLIFLSAD